jgi:hypothetical protein
MPPNTFTESTRFSDTANGRARQEAQRRAGVAKGALGRMAFHTREEYFPGEARSRQRSDRVKSPLAGVVFWTSPRHLAGP